MEIRRYVSGDEAEIVNLYTNTIHQISIRDYTTEQVNRWAPLDPDMAAWTAKLNRIRPFVAVEDDRILGFVELEEDGHIDCFYCHHEWQRKGVGSSLMRAVEAHASSSGIGRLFAEVSTTALEFFRAKGFNVIEERNKVICSVPARQYVMEKHLS